MRKKILWISQLIMAFVLLIYAVFSTQVFYESHTAERLEDLKLLSVVYDETLYPPNEAGAKSLSSRLGGNRVTFIALDGEVLGDSLSGEFSNHAERAEVKEAIAKGEGSAVRASETAGEVLIYYCKKITVSGGGEVLLRLAVPSQSVWAVFAENFPTLVWFFLLDFLICLLFTYLETEYVLRPVRQIAKTASLNLPVETPYEELRPVVDILNKRNREITEKLAELKEEKDLVEKAQRSKNDFIANITHEMNTPLTSIRGYAELLASGSLNEKEQLQATEILLKQSDRLAKLIACIIDYNELDNDDLPPYEVDVSRIARDILDGLAPDIAARSLALTVEVEEGICLQSRFERVNEVLGNLIRNAVRYNRDGGVLKVTLQRTERGARFAVEDTGIGIAEENLERIFDRFFTVDKSHNGKHGGFGLGLAVVKKICRNSGWVIHVKSTLGVGTTFTVDMK